MVRPESAHRLRQRSRERYAVVFDRGEVGRVEVGVEAPSDLDKRLLGYLALTAAQGEVRAVGVDPEPAVRRAGVRFGTPGFALATPRGHLDAGGDVGVVEEPGGAEAINGGVDRSE